MKFVIIVAMFLFNQSSLAQGHCLGFKAGINYSSKIAPNALIQQKGDFSYGAGVNYFYRFVGNLKLSLDLMYIQSTYKSNLYFSEGPVIPTIKELFLSREIGQYLSVPVKLGCEYGEKTFFYWNAGLVNSLMIKSSYSIPTVNEQGEVIKTDVYGASYELRAIELGGIIEVGLGYTFLQDIGIFAELGYYHSFLTVSQTTVLAINRFSNYRPALNFGIRYTFYK
jgi:hypothetical protein